MSAVLCPYEKYRYVLTRPSEIDREGAKPLLVVLLNPPARDTQYDTPTIRILRALARARGYAGITVVSLFALRTDDPRRLLSGSDPIGPDNDSHIATAALNHEHALCAWGTHPVLDRLYPMLDRRRTHPRYVDVPRHVAVLGILRSLKIETYCLKLSKLGVPCLPQPLAAATPFTPFGLETASMMRARRRGLLPTNDGDYR